MNIISVLALLLSKKRQKGKSDYILIAWIITFAFHFSVPFGIEHDKQ